MKVIIADDDELIRESLKIILSQDSEIDIVGTFENGQGAVDYCKNNEVDVALLDIRMPAMNGVEATRRIVDNCHTAVIILTTFDEDDYIREALNYGAKGYLLKNTSPVKIIETIKVVNRGNCVLQPEVLNKISQKLNGRITPSQYFDDSKFTEREVEIIESIAEGLTNKDISRKLFISEGTVKNYISAILDKTGLEHRTQIAIYYLRGMTVEN